MASFSVDVILLDWGGTLARVATQEQAWLRGAQAVSAALSRHGFVHDASVEKLMAVVHEAESAAQRDPRHVEVDVRDVFAAWANACGWTVPGNAIRDEAIQVFGENWVGCLDPYPTALATLAAVRERGYRLGLASNCWTPARYVHQELDRHGFTPYLHGVTLSCEVGYRKPAPVFFATALHNAMGNGRIPPPNRVLFVGDSPIPDIAGPAAAGMRTVLVKNPESHCPREDFERVSPDVCIDSIDEVLAYLPGRL